MSAPAKELQKRVLEKPFMAAIRCCVGAPTTWCYRQTPRGT